jgi:hypothetical protein
MNTKTLAIMAAGAIALLVLLRSQLSWGRGGSIQLDVPKGSRTTTPQILAKSLVGMATARARQLVEANGFMVRVCDTPAGSKAACPWTADLRSNRVNITATSGVVVRATVG